MGLESLSSIFSEDLDLIAEDYQANSPQYQDSIIKHEGGSHIQKIPGPYPILDSLASHPFSDDTISPPGKLYDTYNFDPRIPKNSRIEIINKNVYVGTTHKIGDTIVSSITTNPTDFLTAGKYRNLYTPLYQVSTPKDPDSGRTGYFFDDDTALGSSGGWQALYNANHTPKDSPTNLATGDPFKPYNYGGFVDRDKLDIYDTQTSSFFGMLKRGREPYIVSQIGMGGRVINSGGRYTPAMRAMIDVGRISQYLFSREGLANTGFKNLYEKIPVAVTRDGASEANSPIRVEQQYNRKPLFNPLHVPINVMRGLGAGVNNTALKLGGVFGINDKIYPNSHPQTPAKPKLWESMNDFWDPTSNAGPGPGRTEDYKTMGTDNSGFGGDFITRKGFEDYDPSTFKSSINADGFGLDNKGMPLYFIDLRDNKVIYFRAYIEALTESISPSWVETNYIGRSESTWIYERANRECSFNLKLFAHTSDELDWIYRKMNRLTSMCYPQYQEDKLFKTRAKQRMKPPLLKMRIGDYLGGTGGKELTGFLKSLTYTVPEESPWETRFRHVPKYIDATISYQILHDDVPELFKNDKEEPFEFYGHKLGWERAEYSRVAKSS